jgi:hypothetical protein
LWHDCIGDNAMVHSALSSADVCLGIVAILRAVTRALVLANGGSLASAPDWPCLRVRARICPLTSELPGGSSGAMGASTSMLLAGSRSDAVAGETTPRRLKPLRLGDFSFQANGISI